MNNKIKKKNNNTNNNNNSNNNNNKKDSNVCKQVFKFMCNFIKLTIV